MKARILAGEQKAMHGEMDNISAILATSISPGDIQLAQNVDVEQMKQMDEDPLEVVVEIPAGKSKRGWNYTPKSLQDIVEYTKQYTLNGFLGHQRPEDVSTEFVPPATHWIGAEMRGDKAYFRGLVDADAKSLKRWIRTKRIQEVSIFGFPDLRKNQTTGEMDVVGYEPLSIDWTPLHRPGMPTKIVGMEMNDITGEQLDGTFEKLREDLRIAAKEYFSIGEHDYVWVRSIRYDNNTAIMEYEQQNQPTKLYSIPFIIDNQEIKLGEKTEVVEKKIYEPATPAGEMNKGGKKMDFKELISNLNGLLQTGKVTYNQVFGEMAITPDKLAGEMEEIKEAVEAKETLGKVKEALGVTGEMDVIEVAKNSKKALEESSQKDFTKTIDKVVEKKVTGEMAQGLVKKMLKVEDGATEEVIAGEIDKILADDLMKKVLSDKHIDQGPGIGSAASTTSGLKSKRAQI
ncbi:hypothetical protein Amet_2576 [Alkaliphilus metalliredigens QYMF]|uniref:Uncharacterized protein n=1 Tax=Alkaliphilus metalliredigens (strain QYMF) TaxID=293826 RepID=A6TRB0_ALKMQ|nr:hypothetical protein [Alkaliphilus metalliredigens]ABR48728.1 hypothetical protein Amet_2576 [Alkaliphilus metalliredigens QYMF]